MSDSSKAENLSATELVASLAFGLATLEKHGVKSSETERVIGQIAEARTLIDGSLGELLWATENLLRFLQTTTLGDEAGSLRTLRDVASFIHDAVSPETMPADSSEGIDELLERMDFLASGGTDTEVPRGTAGSSVSSTKFPSVQFPIEPEADIEDPLLTSHIEQARSTSELVASTLVGVDKAITTRLLERYLLHANSIEHWAETQSHVALDELTANLNMILFSTDSFHECQSRVQIKNNFEDVHIYKSLAKLLFPAIEALVEALKHFVLDVNAVSLAINVQAIEEELLVYWDLTNTRSKLAKVLAKRVEKSTQFQSDVATVDTLDESVELTEQALVEAVAKLASIASFLGGFCHIDRNQTQHLRIAMRVPVDTRVLNALQLTIHSSSYAVEAHHIQGVIPFGVAECDFTRNEVAHEGATYDIATLASSKGTHETENNEGEMLVLMRIQDRRIALPVDRVLDVVRWVLRPSGSGIAFGVSPDLSREACLLIDPTSMLLSRNQPREFGMPAQVSMSKVCLSETSEKTKKKFAQTLASMEIDCVVASDLRTTIQAIQEQRPSIVVTELSANGHDSLPRLKQIERHVDTEKTKFFLVVENFMTQEFAAESELRTVTIVASDIPPIDLIDLLEKTLGVQESE